MSERAEGGDGSGWGLATRGLEAVNARQKEFYNKAPSHNTGHGTGARSRLGGSRGVPTCVSASARQSRAQCRAREFCCKIHFTKAGQK